MSLSATHSTAQAARKRTVMASLTAQPFRPPWWLRNPHAQTVWAPLFRRSPAVALRGERWNTPDDDFIDLHFADGDGSNPAVLMLHGLEGSVESTYIRGMNCALCALGWNAITMEFRGCSREMNRAPRMYHSGETSDLAFAVAQLAERYSRLYVAGFSLGGNVLAKWLGESRSTVPECVGGAAVISTPFDLCASSPYIDRALGGFYSRHFLRSLVRKAELKERQHARCVDIARVKAARSLSEFDDHATAALHGFHSARHYYETQRSGQYLAGIRLPTLLLSAADDPFNPASSLPRDIAAQSDYLHPLFTEHGGHVGFVCGTPWRPRYWAEEQILRFFCTYDALLTEKDSNT